MSTKKKKSLEDRYEVIRSDEDVAVLKKRTSGKKMSTGMAAITIHFFSQEELDELHKIDESHSKRKRSKRPRKKNA